MPHLPLVSVIMNCYNGEEFLDDAIRSVVAQTYPNWEIIFWDNASTDNSAAIAKKYEPKLRYFRGEKNVPLGEARALAVSKVNGEYIAFLDCDDLWTSNRLERGVEVMKDPRWAMCYAGVDEITHEGKKLRSVLPAHDSGDLLEGLLRNFDVNIPTWLIRRSALERHGFSFSADFRCSEEYNLSMRLAAREPIATIPEILGAWRCHQGSTTGRTVSNWAIERESALNTVLAENPGIYEKHRAAFDEAFARAHYYRACYRVTQGDRRAAREALLPARAFGFEYNFLYWLLYLPKAFWEFFHSPVIKRKIVPRLLGLAR